MGNVHININLSVQQLMDAIKQLPPSEKISLTEALWDDNAYIPIEHQELVLNRKQKAAENPNRLKNWDEVRKELYSL